MSSIFNLVKFKYMLTDEEVGKALNINPRHASLMLVANKGAVRTNRRRLAETIANKYDGLTTEIVLSEIDKCLNHPDDEFIHGCTNHF